MFYDTTFANVSSHTCNWVVPTGVTGVTFEIWGGGGGGASGNCECDCRVRTGPGGGGGYSSITIPVAPGATYAMTMGNGGVASSGDGGPTSAGAGAARGCCGGTTFITGTGLSNFCAEGGKGGCNDITTNCYSCACQADFGGNAYGGTINFKGGFSSIGRIGSGGCWTFYSIGGDGAGPGGGAGGRNMSAYETYQYGSRCQNPAMDGTLPGGGGAGHGCGSRCCCYQTGSGRGAPGLIKITW